MKMNAQSIFKVTAKHAGKNFDRRHFEIFILCFPENMIGHFMQSVSLRDSVRTYYFSAKIKKTYLICRLLQLSMY